MSDTVEHIFINLSKRSIKLVDEEGYEEVVEWKWDNEGSEGFSETVATISELVDSDQVTYCFANT
tara:strand:+ start:3207 stop:3401 length:195 start_codon:yes stop_codon:yes gene_type:complete